MNRTLRAFGVLALCGAGLAACGETDVERAATGAVIGGALSAATGESITDGALIGGAIGAVSCSVAPGSPNCY